MMFAVVFVAVAPNQVHVLDKVSQILVNIMVQFLFDCTQIHWPFDNVKVIHDVELNWIDWLKEPKCTFLLHYGLEKLCSLFLPSLGSLHFF